MLINYGLHNKKREIKSKKKCWNEWEEKKKLKLTRVSNKNITCNDGSAAGYYLKRTSSSKKWIVYLQGGGFCSNLTSFQTRWQENRDLMTSFNWTEKREGKIFYF